MFLETFRKITKHEKSKGFDPYPYQVRVADAVMAGRNVLLIAPTGSGKTWAAVAPFIHARLNGAGAGDRAAFADRLIYALPLRTLASSLHADVVKAARAAFGEEHVVVSGKERDYRRRDRLYITIQTGEAQDDPLFNGDIIFTTIDQLLSSYINVPLSLPRKLSNINAGALIGAQIVLDEFHLLEEGKSLSTAIEMVDRLRGLASVLIMTATLSNLGCARLASIIDAHQIELEEAERLKLPAESKRQRDWRFVGAPLDASSILSAHKQRTIVLCNTVNRAQDMYLGIKNAAPKDTDVLLLHSRFYPDDRGQKEAEIIRRFGKAAQAKGDSIILVTTQVIEAGMDISCDVLHTEIAPANSLVQRAGRCARYGGAGEVIIYELLEADKTAPYDMKLVCKTRDVLPQEQTAMDFAIERRLIDSVHGVPETGFLDGFSMYGHRQQVARAMSGDDPGAVHALIRDIDNIQAVVTDNPNLIEFSRHKWPMSLSVPRSIVNRAAKDIFNHMWLAELNDTGDDLWSGITWRKMDEPKSIAGAWYVAIHPEVAAYSGEHGLMLGASGSAPEVKYLDRPPIPLYSYKRETFKEHAARSLNAFERISENYSNGLHKLATSLAVGAADVKRLARMIVTLHDLGKLSVEWQSFAQTWQSKKRPECFSQEPLAHTDYDPVEDAAALRSMPPRPPHAAEGAFALGHWLFGEAGLVPGVARAAMSAIARHHSGHTASLREFTFIEGIDKVIDGLVDLKPTGLRAPADLIECKQFPEYLINPLSDEHEPFLPLYWYLARLVRLSDQLATKEVNADEIKYR
ncbi:MAG: CRISPR-associated helicase Cas3' [Actinomycetota bacterium]|nr:CRISPR-associated helicase Cas3' [Actinomycetota bacterium]